MATLLLSLSHDGRIFVWHSLCYYRRSIKMYILLSGKLLNQDHVKTSHRFRNLMLTIMTLLISVEFQCFKCFKLFLGITTCGVIIDHEMLAVFHSFSFSYLFFLFCFGFCLFLFCFWFVSGMSLYSITIAWASSLWHIIVVSSSESPFYQSRLV